MATFVYDGDGNRVKATVGGATTTYVGSHFEWTGSTSTMIKYYYASATRVAMRIGSNTPKWLLSDHLGSQAITVSTNGLTEECELRYKAWGETRFSLGTTPTKRQYTGQISEMATIGLYFYGARFYDPVLSRFTSADSLIPGAGNVQAWDRYAAMANNPVNRIDPTGNSVDCGMWETGCDNGELTPSGLMNLYGNQYDLSNKMSPDDMHGREMLSSEIDGYLRTHPEYNDINDPGLREWDKFSYSQIRNEYWLQRANGNLGEALNLRLYYDYHRYPQVANWDSSRVNWGSVGLDVVSGATAVIGMNPLTKGIKAAQSINVVAGAVATDISVQSEDGIGIVFNGLGFVPGPVGVVGSMGALILDLSKGSYTSPYIPSVPR